MIAWFGASVHLADMAAGARRAAPRKGPHRNSTRRPSSVCWSAARVALARAPGADGGYLPAARGSGRGGGCAVPVASMGRAWWQRAACRGSLEKYFVVPSTREKSRDRKAREKAAKRICAECPVRDACLEYALRVDERLGIWGGMTEGERARESWSSSGARAELRGVSGDRRVRGCAACGCRRRRAPRVAVRRVRRAPATVGSRGAVVRSATTRRCRRAQ